MTQKVMCASDQSAATVVVDTAGYEFVIVSARTLTAAEEIPISIVIGGTSLPVTDTAGTAQKLTATIVALQLAGGPTYTLAKPAGTASNVAVYVDFPTER